MVSVELMFVILFAFLLILTWRTINPKLDWNYETGERLLWYNDPFDSCTRKAVTLWRVKQ
jgi:hypothetical protein